MSTHRDQWRCRPLCGDLFDLIFTLLLVDLVLHGEAHFPMLDSASMLLRY
jgi:hypothetical protein